MKNIKIKQFGILAALMALTLFAFAAPAMAAQEGNVYYSAQPPLATEVYGTVNSTASYIRGVAFPSDDNAQMKILYIDATGNTASDTVDIYAYVRNGGTVYQTTTLAFCGGNTNYLHAPNAMQGQGSVSSGDSFFVLDDGAGNVGWGQYLDKAGAGTGDIIEIGPAGASNFAQGPTGLPDLSGVTFPAGSRVYPVIKIGSFVIGNGNTQTESDSALFAAPRKSPILCVNTDTTTGVTIHGITAERVGLR